VPVFAGILFGGATMECATGARQQYFGSTPRKALHSSGYFCMKTIVAQDAVSDRQPAGRKKQKRKNHENDHLFNRRNQKSFLIGQLMRAAA
jgi:hypothetical protein